MKDKLIILAAGKPHHGCVLSLLQNPGLEGRVMDWILRAFEENIVEPHLMLGYLHESIPAKYKEIKHTINFDWKKNKSAGTFLCSPFTQTKNCYVTYSDILFRKSFVNDSNPIGPLT